MAPAFKRAAARLSDVVGFAAANCEQDNVSFLKWESLSKIVLECMYVCTCVRMYVCTYACTNVCMLACMHITNYRHGPSTDLSQVCNMWNIHSYPTLIFVHQSEGMQEIYQGAHDVRAQC